MPFRFLQDYPPYCLKIETQRDIRRIEQLDAELAASLNAELVQVQAVIRHGARTPSAKHKCWEGYEDEINFQCPVTLLERPSAVRDSSQLLEEEGRLFRKNYRSGRVNLNGNCHIGQLVEEGLEQCHIRCVRGPYVPSRPKFYYFALTLETSLTLAIIHFVAP